MKDVDKHVNEMYKDKLYICHEIRLHTPVDKDLRDKIMNRHDITNKVMSELNKKIMEVFGDIFNGHICSVDSYICGNVYISDLVDESEYYSKKIIEELTKEG